MCKFFIFFAVFAAKTTCLNSVSKEIGTIFATILLKHYCLIFNIDSMKKILTIVAVLMFTLTACADHNQLIKYSELPAQAQSFIQKYFAPSEVSYIEREREGFHYEYTMYLNDGTEIDFDQQGNLQLIDCKNLPVPEGIVPESIVNYVQLHHPSHFIVEYEIGYRYQKVELNAGELELLFDRDGHIVGIDD